MRKIESVEIRDIKGIEHLDLKVGSVTTISGANGVGKSSVLDAIKAVFEGGHDPGLIRRGAEQGSIEIHLSDGVTIKKRITPKQSTLTVRAADGSIIRAPKRYVDRLAGGLGFDPLRFVDAPAKKRIEWMLELMPITFTPEELHQAVGDRAPSEPMNLQRFQEFRDGIFAERADINRKRRDLEGNIRTLADSLPSEEELDPEVPQKLKEVREELAMIRNGMSERVSKINLERAEKKSAATMKAQREIEAIKARLSGEIEQIDQEAESAVAAVQAVDNPRIEEHVQQIAKLEEQEKARQRAIGVQQSLERLRDRLRDYDSFALTENLKKLDELKRRKLSELPVEGIDIIDGEIYIDGVKWDHVNLSARIVAAVQVGMLGMGELNMFLLDEAEHLDDGRFEEFLAAVKEAGLSVIAARVGEEPRLAVEVQE